MHVWTLEIGGVGRKYRGFTFYRTEDAEPVTLEATVKYANDIDYFDVIEAKNNGTTEWYGYVEKIKIAWDKNGRYMVITARDRKLLTWKKWTERFTDTRLEGGFFGSVNAVELLKFIMRCPISDVVLDANGKSIPNHKIGWGVASNNFNVSAQPSIETCLPEWAKARYVGFAWQNRGTPYNFKRLEVNQFIVGGAEWDKTGVEPYLNDAGGEPEDTRKISSQTMDVTSDFGFENLPVKASSINKVKVGMWIKTNAVTGPARAKGEVYLWRDSTSSWVKFAEWEGVTTSYKFFEFDLTNDVAIVSDVNSLKIRFKNKSTGLASHVTYMFLTVSYGEEATQEVGDYFKVDLKESKDEVMGIIVQSRKSSNQYARNYVIECATEDESKSGVTDEGSVGFGISIGNIAIIGPWSISADTTIHGIYVYIDASASQELKGVVYKVNNGVPDNLALVATGNVVTTPAIASRGWFFIPITANVSNGDVIYFGFCLAAENGVTLLGEDAGTTKNLYTKVADCTPPNPFGATGAALVKEYSAYFVYGGDYEEVASVTSNTFQNIIHSWTPRTARYIRMKITAKESSCGWQISQVYVYRADEIKYRVYLDGLEEPSGEGYVGGPYIEDWDIDSFSTPVNGINLPFARMIDNIQAIIDRCHENYVPYQWWISHIDGKVYFAQRKGLDHSIGNGVNEEISFVKATNLGGAERESNTQDTIQRVKVVGKSEAKKQDDISSDWKENSTAMDTINSFYEEIVSEKTISDKDTADTLANIHQTQNGPVEELITFEVDNDQYDPMAYDVDDDVTVIDSLTGLNGVKRIRTIRKEISKNGEKITLYLGTKWKDFSDEWAKFNRKLSQLSLTGTAIEDWLGEGAEQSKLDARDVTETFEKNAENDEEKPPADKTDEKWVINAEDGVSGQNFETGDDWMSLTGRNASGESSLEGYINIPTIYLNQNPKLVCEFKIYVGDGFTTWHDGDELDVFVASNGDPWKGIGFIVQKVDDEYKLYGCFHPYDAGNYKVLLQTLYENMKYRIEIVLDWENHVVKYYVQDPDGTNDLEFRALLEIPEDVSPMGFLIYPLRAGLYTIVDNPPTTYSKVYVYKFKSQWKARQ